MKVTLTMSEVLMAATIGVMRQISALKRKLPDRHGCTKDVGWQVHIEGACGELAAAKAMGKFWDGGINTFKASDIGESIQVRTRSRHDFDLIVRSDDSDTDWFVLVTGVCPEYEVRGGIRGADAKMPEYLNTFGGREPAYFVPAGALTETRTNPPLQ